MINNLPEKFVRLMTEAHGEKGILWLAELPEIIEEIEENWSLKVGKPFENLSYHFVAPCVQNNGGESVLKIGFPEEDSPIFNEAETLKLYNGDGAIKFLEIDEKRLALLLEKLTPGKHLQTVFLQNPDKAIDVAVEVLQKIQRKVPDNHNFILLESWFSGFEKAKNTNFPAHSIKKAQNFYEELANNEKRLIHGDFHHENVLSAERKPFLVIDPKGVIGQIGYEISVFLNNHVWWLAKETQLHEHLAYAVKEFGETFEIEPHVLQKWAYAQAILSAWWTFEENSATWQTELGMADVWKFNI